MKWNCGLVWGSALMLGLGVSACSEPESEPAASDEGTAAQQQASTAVEQPYRDAAPGPGAPAGTVLETMDSGGYTYARVAVEDAEIWVASPTSKVAVGDTVSLAGADNMGPFKSKTLDRTFEQVFFIDKFRPVGVAVTDFSGTITETMNVAGYTYAKVTVGEDLKWMTSPDAGESAVWLAAPETQLSVGDVVRWDQGAVMKDFHSSTLDRTFAEILFVGALTKAM